VSGHELWHALVLSTTLFGAAGLAIIVLAPLVFDEPPPGLVRARPLVVGAIAAAVVLLLVEWLAIH
jgi:hypothetical protein